MKTVYALSIAVTLCWLPSGCAFDVQAGPQDVYVITNLGSSEDRRYGLELRSIPTVTTSPLQTEHFSFRSGFGHSDDLALTSPFRPSFDSESDGLFPLDYPTLVAFTAAYHFELAYSYYETLGLGEIVEAPNNPYPVLIHSRVGLAPVGPFALFISDNAGFLPGGKNPGFFIFPNHRFAGAKIPMAASQFILTHEVGHAMFSLLQPDLSGPGVNALNEGLADVFAFGATLDFHAFEDAIPEPYVTALAFRDPRTRQVWSLETEITAYEGHRYPLGSVLVSSLYSYVEKTSPHTDDQHVRMHAVARMAFHALASWRPELLASTDVHPIDFVNHLVRTLPSDEDVTLLCESMREHWGELAEGLEGC